MHAKKKNMQSFHILHISVIRQKCLKGDTSLMTYRGHCVLHTLIRCHFSPAFSTAQRYIYSGCANGTVVSKWCILLTGHFDWLVWCILLTGLVDWLVWCKLLKGVWLVSLMHTPNRPFSLAGVIHAPNRPSWLAGVIHAPNNRLYWLASVIK